MSAVPVLSALMVALLALPAAAVAQGFSVNEHGTCQMGRAGTGTASPCADGSAILFNPAFTGMSDNWVVSIGVTAIGARGGFTDDLTQTETRLDNPLIPVPHGYIAGPLTDRIGIGLGLFVPYGLGTQWPRSFEGRFNGYDNDLRSIYVQPTASYRITDKLSVGAGFDIVISSIELNQFLDLSEFPVPANPSLPAGTLFRELGVPFHTQFADAELSASGATGFGGNFGIRYEPADRFRLGLRYLMQVSLDYEGDATFEPAPTRLFLPPNNPFGLPAGTPVDLVLLAAFASGAPLEDQTVRTSITMPQQLQGGIAFRATDALWLMVDYQWMDWSVFDVLTVDFSNAALPTRSIVEDYRDTHAIRFGADWEFAGASHFRAGYLYHTGAAPDQTVTPLLPEGRRSEFTAGFGVPLLGSARADFAYQFILQEDRRGRVREPEAGSQATVDLNSGLYTFKAHLGAITLSYTF